MTTLNKLISLASAIDNQLLLFDEQTLHGGEELRKGMTINMTLPGSILYSLDKELYLMHHDDLYGFEHRGNVEVNILGMTFNITSKTDVETETQ